MTHPVQQLDETVHQRTRLGILAVLVEGGRVQFGYLQESLGLTDGNLSRHLRILEEAGYVRVDKGYEGRRPRTSAQVTKAGRRAVAEEVRLLEALVAQLSAPRQDQPEETPTGTRVAQERSTSFSPTGAHHQA